VRPLALGAVVLLALAWGAVSILHVGHFADDEALWQHERRLQPRNPLVHLFAAYAMWDAGRPIPALEAARAAYEHAVLESDRSEAAVAWASLRLEQARASEREVVTRLRGFFDALATRSGRIEFEVERKRFRIDPDTRLRQALRSTASFRRTRAAAHARMHSLGFAERELRGLLAAGGGAASARLLAEVLACQARWGEAEAVARDAARRHPGDAALARTLATLQRARELQADPDPIRRAARQLRIVAELGYPESAAVLLWSLAAAAPDHVEARIARAFIDAAAGQTEAARRALEEGRRGDPAQRAPWEAARADLERLLVPPAAP
jgi:hypothetical protein